MPLNKKPDPKAPFDPLARRVMAPRDQALFRNERGRRLSREAHAREMAAHLQLSPTGRIPDPEVAHSMSNEERDRYEARFLDFPDTPDEVVGVLEDILKRYGLPMARLSSDTAAFVYRRVLIERGFMANLHRRRDKEGLFEPEELLELMRVLRVNAHQLADLICTAYTPSAKYAAYVAINRWLAKINRPRGLIALKANRLIEQNVRRKGTRGDIARPRPERLSQRPETVKRREDKLRQRRRAASQLDIPLAPSARRHRDAETE